MDWDALWDALKQHDVSQHIIWILQGLYHDQSGQVHDVSGSSREFYIKGSVRQGCVLSPRLFCSILQIALKIGRGRVEHVGIDLDDDMKLLLDLRFADDFLLFANTAADAAFQLDEICAALGTVRLILNSAKIKVLTSESQAPFHLTTQRGGWWRKFFVVMKPTDGWDV